MTKSEECEYSRRTLLSGLVSLGLLSACGFRQAGSEDSDTITMAVSDDPIRRFAFYGIEAGRVDKRGIDIQIRYLPVQSTQQIYQTREYDVVEISPLNIALAAERGLETLILSGGIIEHAATVIHVPAQSLITEPLQLRGRRVGIANTTATSTVLLRYALMEKYELTSDLGGGDVSLLVTPPDAIRGLFETGALAGAVNLHRSRYLLERQGGFRPIMNISRTISELTGADPVQVVLATYPGVAARKGDVLDRFNTVLLESGRYALDHISEVTEAISNGDESETDYVRWWLGTCSLSFGRPPEEIRRGVEAMWRMATALGIMESSPSYENLSRRQVGVAESR